MYLVFDVVTPYSFFVERKLQFSALTYLILSALEEDLSSLAHILLFMYSPIKYSAIHRKKLAMKSAIRAGKVRIAKIGYTHAPETK